MNLKDITAFLAIVQGILIVLKEFTFMEFIILLLCEFIFGMTWLGLHYSKNVMDFIEYFKSRNGK